MRRWVMHRLARLARGHDESVAAAGTCACLPKAAGVLRTTGVEGSAYVQLTCMAELPTHMVRTGRGGGNVAHKEARHSSCTETAGVHTSSFPCHAPAQQVPVLLVPLLAPAYVPQCISHPCAAARPHIQPALLTADPTSWPAPLVPPQELPPALGAVGGGGGGAQQ
jgi:hypothetical protein